MLAAHEESLPLAEYTKDKAVVDFTKLEVTDDRVFQLLIILYCCNILFFFFFFLQSSRFSRKLCRSLTHDKQTLFFSHFMYERNKANIWFHTEELVIGSCQYYTYRQELQTWEMILTHSWSWIWNILPAPFTHSFTCSQHTYFICVFLLKSNGPVFSIV